MNEVTLTMVMTEDGQPVRPGDLMVIHVDRKDVECPSGWTQNAAKGASGKFFWRTAVVNEAITITLWSPSSEPFVVDAMALSARSTA